LLGPPLALLPQLQLCPVLRAPELDAGLPGGSPSSKVFPQIVTCNSSHQKKALSWLGGSSASSNPGWHQPYLPVGFQPALGAQRYCSSRMTSCLFLKKINPLSDVSTESQISI